MESIARNQLEQWCFDVHNMQAVTAGIAKILILCLLLLQWTRNIRTHDEARNIGFAALLAQAVTGFAKRKWALWPAKATNVSTGGCFHRVLLRQSKPFASASSQGARWDVFRQTLWPAL